MNVYNTRCYVHFCVFNEVFLGSLFLLYNGCLKDGFLGLFWAIWCFHVVILFVFDVSKTSFVCYECLKLHPGYVVNVSKASFVRCECFGFSNLVYSMFQRVFL